MILASSASKASILTATLGILLLLVPSGNALVYSLVEEAVPVPGGMVKCDSDTGVGTEELEACAVECETGDHIAAETRMKNVDAGESYQHLAEINCGSAEAVNSCSNYTPCNTDDAGGIKDTETPGDGKCDGYGATSKFERYTIELWCSVSAGTSDTDHDSIFLILTGSGDACEELSVQQPHVLSYTTYHARLVEVDAGNATSTGLSVMNGECYAF